MRPTTMRPTAVLLAVLLAALAGCGSGGGIEGPFTGASVTLRAVGIAWEPTSLTLPANTPLRIVLQNDDEGIPHNVRVFQGEQVFGTSPTVRGIATTEVRFGPLPAARYQFVCDVHPDMIGTLVVTP
jgi:plastocyanin